jgi:hypothetical protein
MFESLPNFDSSNCLCLFRVYYPASDTPSWITKWHYILRFALTVGLVINATTCSTYLSSSEIIAPIIVIAILGIYIIVAFPNVRGCIVLIIIKIIDDIIVASNTGSAIYIIINIIIDIVLIIFVRFSFNIPLFGCLSNN